MEGTSRPASPACRPLWIPPLSVRLPRRPRPSTAAGPWLLGAKQRSLFVPPVGSLLGERRQRAGGVGAAGAAGECAGGMLGAPSSSASSASCRFPLPSPAHLWTGLQPLWFLPCASAAARPLRRGVAGSLWLGGEGALVYEWPQGPAEGRRSSAILQSRPELSEGQPMARPAGKHVLSLCWAPPPPPPLPLPLPGGGGGRQARLAEWRRQRERC